MITKNTFKFLFFALILSSSFISCDDSNSGDDPVAENEVKSGELTANETWTSDRIYELDGKVIVSEGVTLTIQPGTIIKGKQGDGLNASALIVARGGKINAVGNEEHPIIFTSILDNIEIGQNTGTNLDENDAQKWGGLIILGKAEVSDKVGDTEGHIEGIPADAAYGTYGGNNNADNSGTLQYVSIRHGGISIGDGNEINGLTLGGVGSGTTINHIEIVANLDDGIECFGGAVTINHALVAYQQDDAFDIDQNFSGSFINSMVVYKSSVGDEFLEIDGPENSTHVDGLFTVKNCLFIDKDNAGSCDLKSKAQGVVKNNEFSSLEKFKISTKLEDCTTILTDAYTHYIDGTLKIISNKTDATLHVYTKSTDNADVVCDLMPSIQTNADAIFNVAGNASTIQVNVVNQSEFDWTWTAINNKM